MKTFAHGGKCLDCVNPARGAFDPVRGLCQRCIDVRTSQWVHRGPTTIPAWTEMEPVKENIQDVIKEMNDLPRGGGCKGGCGNE